jgi:16S rRNA (cytosine1402-N4)-methyltransferase
MPDVHIPVLLEAVIEGLRCREQTGVYVDCTLGDGGHSRVILAAHPANEVIGIDQDQQVLERAGKRLKNFGRRLTLVEGNFRDLGSILAAQGKGQVKGVLADLGFSSFQLEDENRGFSFQSDAPLDMRMSRAGKVTAADLLNELSARELGEIFRRYGEERYARRIAAAIGKKRAQSPLKGTQQLVSIIQEAVPAVYRYRSKIHFATRTFQALRIAVNEELPALESLLPAAVEVLSPGGRLAIISFHSLEDRMVKAFFKKMSAACHCPPRIPQCVCNAQPTLRIITSKPIVADEGQIILNPRARSAKLRLAERLGG